MKRPTGQETTATEDSWILSVSKRRVKALSCRVTWESIGDSQKAEGTGEAGGRETIVSIGRKGKAG